MHLTLEKIAVSLHPRISLPWLAVRMFGRSANSGNERKAAGIWMDLNYEGKADTASIIEAFKTKTTEAVVVDEFILAILADALKEKMVFTGRT